ncbi:HNH endonuclease [Allosphingosinicella indica]|uniref:5-methylcytosine-specific restriction endonuclease McrA n=1 Tax=Allosphingosinicella indica TaxID=941907 RepID=A0A1X7GK88_9SPHN|nr:HNH endonuclease signature motif containing protein [Allosphingosinicella indica]SMF70600.1 5-methylcytosine-specific restriction endonuclease McrA [Allosphingosinicella indica]
MGRLRMLKPERAVLRPTRAAVGGGRVEVDRVRNRQAWRRWYSTARWKALRWKTLLRDAFTCQMCGRVEPETSKLVADHKRRHGGDEAAFFDAANLWTLCKPCHDGAKQREERRAEACR